jgi:hypothetical protein
LPTRVLAKAGDDLLSRYSHYHGPQVLNGRVRNGNGCGHLGMVTGKTQWRVVSEEWRVNATRPHGSPGISKRQRIKLHLCMRSLSVSCGIAWWFVSNVDWRFHSPLFTIHSPLLTKELINAVKRLAVSTGKLRPLLTLHIRPIDPVVFREPMYRSTGNVILRRVSRLYAFSVYPGRT